MRAWPALAAAALLVALYALPLAAWIGHFPAHMARHMALVAVVPPLAVAAWRDWPRALVPGVLIAAVAEFALVWGWHLPALHAAAAQAPAVFALEQASFLMGGLLVWSSALRAEVPLAGAGAMLLTSMHMTLLGALLVLSPRVLYGGDAPLWSQQAGGLIMLGIGTPAYLAGGLWLAAKALGEEAR